MKEITPKQRLFCLEYLKDRNGTQAAIRAGYSKHTANEQSAQLLAKLSIKEFLASKMQKQEEKLEITAEYILAGIKRMAEVCGKTVTVPEDEIKNIPSREIPVDASAALKALELLGKNKKLFVDKVEHSGDIAPVIIFTPAESNDNPKSK